MEDCAGARVSGRGGEGGFLSGRDALQMPDSKPAAKQLESLLKETDSTAVGLDVSMGGRTFMARPVRAAVRDAAWTGEARRGAGRPMAEENARGYDAARLFMVVGRRVRWSSAARRRDAQPGSQARQGSARRRAGDGRAKGSAQPGGRMGGRRAVGASSSAGRACSSTRVGRSGSMRHDGESTGRCAALRCGSRTTGGGDDGGRRWGATMAAAR